jgi:peptidoglycan hydrolase-like protein with peptidoglycan-binding domain
VLGLRIWTVGRFFIAILLVTALGPVVGARAASTSSLGGRTLNTGMQGGDVRTLQIELNNAGFKTPVNGIFGTVTTQSVKSFERRFGLPVKAVVDTAFVQTLDEVLFGAPGPANSHPLGSRKLAPGMRGPDVKILQRDLTTSGYPTSADGQFGPATKARVLDFERDNGLIANGVVSYHQTQILRQLVAIVAIGGQDSGLGASTPVSTPSTNLTGTTKINPDGTATAPAGAPRQVQEVVAAANQIIHTPYVWGGGHGSWNSRGYDCSGSVSYALHGGGLLSSPEVSGALETYGASGPGKWITIYANASHVFMVVAGRAFDTANFGGPNIPGGTGPRWRSNPTGNLSDGAHYWVAHPPGL